MDFKTLFHFGNENISILEVKREDVPANAPKEDKFFWLKLDAKKQTISRLIFKAMESEDVNGNEISVREFEGAELRFDSDIAKFATMEEAHLMLNKSNEELSAETETHLKSYLGSL